ncbi:MAG TPA: EamA family transporter [Anaerolineales bacterium]
MKVRIAAAMVAIYLIWGSTYLAIRFAVETIPPFIMAGTRYLIPGLLLLGWRRLAGDPAPTRKQWIAGAIVGLFLLLGGNGLVSWAEQRVDSGVAALIIATAPIWMVLFNAALIRKRPRWQVIVGLLTGFGGILLLIGADSLFGRGPRYDLSGMGILMLAAFLWAIGSIYSRDANLPQSPLLGTGIEMLAGSAGLYLASLVTGEWKTFNLAAISQHSLMGLLYLMVFGTLIGFVAYTWLLRNAPISLVSTYAYVNPLVAILLGNWLAKESLNWQVVFSAVIIIGSVVLINSFRLKPASTPAD